MTSLFNKKIYSHEIFKYLYFQRWGVEEDYKIMKSRLTIENFSDLIKEIIGVKKNIQWLIKELDKSLS